MDDKKGSIKRMQDAFNQPKQRKDSIESLTAKEKQVSIDEINKTINNMVDKLTLDVAVDRIIQELKKPEFFEKCKGKISCEFVNIFLEETKEYETNIDWATITEISVIAAKNILTQLCNQNMKKPQL